MPVLDMNPLRVSTDRAVADVAQWSVLQLGRPRNVQHGPDGIVRHRALRTCFAPNLNTAIVTGSGGLIGSQSVSSLIEAGWRVIGIENDMRSEFFGPSASTRPTSDKLSSKYEDFEDVDLDIRDTEGVSRVFSEIKGGPDLVVHTAAQPSHDWAARDPQTDFGVNALGTLNLLEASRANNPDAPFIFCSTNKVYGDLPNQLPLLDLEERLELPEDHHFYKGIDTSMSIDQSTHSLFGVSKASADLLVQEYGRYFGMPSVCFRGGCLTGPQHAGAELHGFLAYLMKCVVTGSPYTVFGYEGKQVRDNIHCADLVSAFMEFQKAPRVAAVYNIGGGRRSNCSMLEAINDCQRIAGRKLNWTMSDENRIGDHRWWISDLEPFERDYPGWRQQYRIEEILTEIYKYNAALEADARSA